MGLFPVNSRANQIVDTELQQLQDDVSDELANGLMAAVPLMMGRDERPPDAVVAAIEEIELQQQYLDTSFIPEIRKRIMEFLDSPEGAALEFGVLIAALGGLTSRLVSYAGSKFKLLNALQGLKLQAEDKRIYWMRDPAANSCPDCAQWGDHEWPSYDEMIAETGGLQPGKCQCVVKCRCILVGAGPGGTWARG